MKAQGHRLQLTLTEPWLWLIKQRILQTQPLRVVGHPASHGAQFSQPQVSSLLFLIRQFSLDGLPWCYSLYFPSLLSLGRNLSHLPRVKPRVLPVCLPVGWGLIPPFPAYSVAVIILPTPRVGERDMWLLYLVSLSDHERCY